MRIAFTGSTLAAFQAGYKLDKTLTIIAINIPIITSSGDITGEKELVLDELVEEVGLLDAGPDAANPAPPPPLPPKPPDEAPGPENPAPDVELPGDDNNPGKM